MPLGLVLSAALVWHTSTAAFTATTENADNSWTAGTVTLADDDTGSAMFTATAVEPGETGQRCIQVTYGGTVDADVRLYVGSMTAGTPNLAPHVRLTVEEGTTGGTFTNNCAGFAPTATLVSAQPLSTLATARTGFGNGVSTWAPAGGASTYRVYRFSWEINPATPNNAQGGSAQATFTWEAQTSP